MNFFKWLLVRDLRSVEQRNRIDDKRALFRVARETWRYTEGERAVDIYIEGVGKELDLDTSSVNFWHFEKFRQYDPRERLPSLPNEKISDAEREDIILRVTNYLRERFGYKVFIMRPNPTESRP